MKVIHLGPTNKVLVGLDGSTVAVGQSLYVRSQPVELANGYGTFSYYKVKLTVSEINRLYATCQVIKKNEDNVRSSDPAIVEINDPVYDNPNLLNHQP